MNFWPSDTAGRIADGLTAIGFLSSVAAGVFAKMRGTMADKAAKAANRAVYDLRKEYQRRDLLPPAAQRYQKLYLELAPLLTKPVDPNALPMKLGELQGMLNALDAYLDEREKVSLKIVLNRLDHISKEPTAHDHSLDLLREAAAFSVELDIIVKRVKWNSQS